MAAPISSEPEKKPRDPYHCLHLDCTGLLIPFPASQSTTVIERKLRVPQIHGGKGEAVVAYCEPLTTMEMGYHRLSRRVNKIERFFWTSILHWQKIYNKSSRTMK